MVRNNFAGNGSSALWFWKRNPRFPKNPSTFMLLFNDLPVVRLTQMTYHCKALIVPKLHFQFLDMKSHDLGNVAWTSFDYFLWVWVGLLEFPCPKHLKSIFLFFILFIIFFLWSFQWFPVCINLTMVGPGLSHFPIISWYFACSNFDCSLQIVVLSFDFFFFFHYFYNGTKFTPIRQQSSS